MASEDEWEQSSLNLLSKLDNLLTESTPQDALEYAAYGIDYSLQWKEIKKVCVNSSKP